MALLKLKGVVQNYAWGGTQYIPNLIGEKATGEKCAEYWMGAHDKAPATITSTSQPFNEYIASNTEQLLGSYVNKAFGSLPFLFKVLDVNDMLSIQVHPTKVEALKGYQRENELGIPLSAPHRNYKDDNHKPEIMVALGEFWLLHGFQPEAKLISTLKETPELSHLLEVFEQEGYKGLYQQVMEESAEETNTVLKPLIDRVLPAYKAGSLDKSNPDYWAAKAFMTFCPEGDLDKGIYSIYFFNIVKVEAGEAVFQDAGVPHAYMEGQNMELMANSDNVLRGGLTPKHVDVPELLKHVAFDETIPNILKGVPQTDGIERIYKSPAPDFELSKLELSTGSKYESTAQTVEVMIVFDGEVEAHSAAVEISLMKGEVFSVSAGDTYNLRASKDTIIYKAKCPIS